MKNNDLKDQSFDRLTVIEKTINKHGRPAWLCVCQCGNYKVVTGWALQHHSVRSCGCLHSDTISKPFGEAFENELFGILKRNARKDNRQVTLTKDEYRLLIRGNCYYCDKAPQEYNVGHKNRFNGTYFVNGIDRVNNDLDYIYSNCVSSCQRCNRAKLTMTQEEFLQLARTIARRFPDQEG